MAIISSFDPVQRAARIEDLVMRNGKRKYYRFRASRHYSGIVTADAVGCCFLCAYCWNYERNECPAKYGTFYAPEYVAEKLQTIARKKHLSLFRVSGAEPILGRRSFAHLIDVLRAGRFVIETNGLMLGADPDLIRQLSGRDVVVRVSIKGWDEQSFEQITGADGTYFQYPLLALRHMEEAGVRAWPAVMVDLFGENGFCEIRRRLADLGIESRIEVEHLERYPFVLENMSRRGILPV